MRSSLTIFKAFFVAKSSLFSVMRFSTSFPIPICVQTTDNHHEKSIRKSECVGSFNIYVDIIWPFFDNLFTSLWTFLTLIVDKNRHFWTSYPPHLVHVVIEGPRRRNLAAKIIGAEQVAVFWVQGCVIKRDEVAQWTKNMMCSETIKWILHYSEPNQNS